MKIKHKELLIHINLCNNFSYIFFLFFFTQQGKQSHRGGLSLCLNDKGVANEFRNIVDDGTCSKKRKSSAKSCQLKKRPNKNSPRKKIGK